MNQLEQIVNEALEAAAAIDRYVAVESPGMQQRTAASEWLRHRNAILIALGAAAAVAGTRGQRQ